MILDVSSIHRNCHFHRLPPCCTVPGIPTLHPDTPSLNQGPGRLLPGSRQDAAEGRAGDSHLPGCGLLVEPLEVCQTECFQFVQSHEYFLADLPAVHRTKVAADRLAPQMPPVAWPAHQGAWLALGLAG